MTRRPPRFRRTSPLFPSTTPFRSPRLPHLLVDDRLRGRPRRAASAARRARLRARPRRASLAHHAAHEGARPEQPAEPHRRDALEAGAARRSEEHTSELQSLMRISYAVFCLKKKIRIQYTIKT